MDGTRASSVRGGTPWWAVLLCFSTGGRRGVTSTSVSHSYGYGLLDAAAIVALARNWTNVGPQQKCVISMVSEPRNIGTRLVVTGSVDACLGKPNSVSSLEHVQAQLTLSYNRRGNLAIHLVSPQGTRSTLLAPRPHDYSSEGFNDWAFMSTHSWDEDPRGEWTLEIENVAESNDYGTLTLFTLVLYGTASAWAGSSAPDSNPLPEDGCKTVDLSQICTECNPGFYLYQQSCVRECPPGLTAARPPLGNDLGPAPRPACVPCHEQCLTCVGTGPESCLSCPPHSHLDPASGTCLHQNQILRESPDAGPYPSRPSGGPGGAARPLSGRLPVSLAVLCCALIVVTFGGVFALLQVRSRGLLALYGAEPGRGGGGASSALPGFVLGMGRSNVVFYKGIPTMSHETGGNTDSENEEYDVQNEKTAFIRTQSAL